MNHTLIHRLRRKNGGLGFLEVISQWSNVRHVALGNLGERAVFNHEALVTIAIEHKVTADEVMRGCVDALGIPEPLVKLSRARIGLDCPFTV